MSGLIAFTGPPDLSLADRMLARLGHRGSVVTKPFEKPFGTVAVCEWPAAPKLGVCQTGCYQTQDAVWAVSGFTFNAIPPTFSPEQLGAIRGSFGIACLAVGQLHVARDPAGCQSLYYGHVGTRWLVATEPKVITAEAAFQRRIRPAAIAQYLAFSFVPGGGTMLEELYEVEAGHVVTLNHAATPQVRRVFCFEQEEWDGRGEKQSIAADTPPLSEGEWIQRTRDCIERAVTERLVGDEPAVFLSGGLDSSIVAAEVARQCPKPIRTFSIHFGDKYPHELEFARAVADRIGSRHQEVLIRPKQFLPRLRQMIWHLDEPIGDPITQPNFELAAIVGRQASCVFNGEGGDPLFGGPKNLPMLLLHWYGVGPRPKNFREQAYLASYRRAYEEWSQILTPDVRRQINPEHDLEGPLTPYFQATQPRSFLNKLMMINIRLKGANLILPKVDRMLAAHGLTPLSPLFDDQLTRLSFQLPPTMKLRAGIEKYVLKRAYEDLLPRGVIDRPKSGMRVPVHYWFRTDLRRYARSVLSKRNLLAAGIFDPARVRQLLAYETEEGAGRFGLKLWMLLTFELWRQLVVEGVGYEPPAPPARPVAPQDQRN